MSELATRRSQSVAEYAEVDYSKALEYLGLNPKSPQAHALVLVCKRYQLDPLLGHVSLYDGKPYVHFVGYLHLANNHAQYAGMECVREWEDDVYRWATVRVHRADRPFPSERTGKSRKVKPKKDGGKYEDDMADAKAFAQAARRALRMAFNVDAPEPAEDEETAAPAPVVEVARAVDQQAGAGEPSGPPAGEPAPAPTSERQAATPDDTRDNGPVEVPSAAGVGHVRGARRPGPASSDPTSGGEATSPASPPDYQSESEVAAGASGRLGTREGRTDPPSGSGLYTSGSDLDASAAGTSDTGNDVTGRSSAVEAQTGEAAERPTGDETGMAQRPGEGAPAASTDQRGRRRRDGPEQPTLGDQPPDPGR